MGGLFAGGVPTLPSRGRGAPGGASRPGPGISVPPPSRPQPPAQRMPLPQRDSQPPMRMPPPQREPAPQPQRMPINIPVQQPPAPVSSPTRSAPTSNGSSSSSSGLLGYCKANYAFPGQRSGDLAFNVGDVIGITSKNPNGWWTGALGGATGQFPSNYVEEIEHGIVFPSFQSNYIL